MLFKPDWFTQHHRGRKRETEKAFSSFGDRRFASGLEVGAGDGYQTSLLAPRFERFVSVDLNFDRIKIRVPGVEYRKADADHFEHQFTEGEFDVIFSSSFLEHLSNPKHFLNVSREYLKDEGFAIHVVPVRFMKIAYMVMFYPNLFLLILDRLWGKIRGRPLFQGAAGASENNINEQEVRGKTSTRDVGRFRRIFLPSIHGMYRTHTEEFIMWGERHWDELFTSTGYEIEEKIRGPVYSGYGFGFESLRALLERLGFASLVIYVLRKRTHLHSHPDQKS